MALKLRCLALLEVALVFCSVHVIFRAVKVYTPWGQWESRNSVNFIPGLVMIGASLILLSRGRRSSSPLNADRANGEPKCARDFEATHDLRTNVIRNTSRPMSTTDQARVTLLFLLASFAVGAALNLADFPGNTRDVTVIHGLALGVTNLGLTALLLAILNRGSFLSGTSRLGPAQRRWIPWTLLLVLALAPAGVALWKSQPIGSVSVAILWRWIGTGIGEELFFRGYIQSRLNRSFGRPWRFCGVHYGPGLVIAALLFGLIHLLNPYDYFSHSGDLAWGHAIMTTGACYGFVRERCQSIWAPAMIHGLFNSTLLIPSLLSS